MIVRLTKKLRDHFKTGAFHLTASEIELLQKERDFLLKRKAYPFPDAWIQVCVDGPDKDRLEQIDRAFELAGVTPSHTSAQCATSPPASPPLH
jgi:hypothetical protein